MPVCNAAGEKFPKVADNFFIKVNADDSSELGVVEGKGQEESFSSLCQTPEREFETARCWY